MTVAAKFPVGAFPGGLAEFCNAIAEHTQTDPGLAACAMLGVTSAAALGIEVDCSGWVEQAGLYLLVAMDAASRKSSVLRSVVAPLVAIDRERRIAGRAALAEARTAVELAQKTRERLLRDHARTTVELDRKRLEHEIGDVDRRLLELGSPHGYRRLAADATPEALAGLLSAHGKIAVISAEGAFLDNLVGGRYAEGAANLHLTCQAYSGEATVIDRRARDVEEIERPLLAITLIVQPHHLAALIDHPVARAQGLVSRFAFVTPPSKVGRRRTSTPPIPPELADEWAAAVRHISQLVDGDPSTTLTAPTKRPSAFNFSSENSGLVSAVSAVRQRELGINNNLLLLYRFSGDSQELFDTARRELEPELADGGRLEADRAWANRIPGRIARLALLLHLLNGGAVEEIPAATMEDALAVNDYLVEHSLVALGQPDPEVRRAQEIIARWNATTITPRDIQRYVLYGRSTAKRAREIAEQLDAMGIIETVDEDRRGRPTLYTITDATERMTA